MFCTLRHTPQSDGVYTFETTTPPYSKKRGSKPAKVACVTCRMSKLKCSGELDGCQRCLAKEIECRFPPPATSSGTSTEKKGSLPTPSEPPPTLNRASSATESPPDDDSRIVASSHEALEYGGSFDFEAPNFDPLQDADALLFTSQLSPSEEWLHPAIFTAETDASSQNEMSWVEEYKGHCVRSGSSLWASSEKGPPTSSESESTEFCYTCLVKVMKTHEAIMSVYWNSREQDDCTNETLHEQKKAMVECQELLECNKCVAQPACIMLVLSICSKILRTLEAVFSDLRGAGKDENTGKSRPILKRRCTGRIGDLQSGWTSRVNRQPVYGMGNNKTQLDNEDGLLVLQSLLNARVAKLKGLLGRLHIVVSEHNWPAQKAFIQELQGRFMDWTFAVESSGAEFR